MIFLKLSRDWFQLLSISDATVLFVHLRCFCMRFLSSVSSLEFGFTFCRSAILSLNFWCIELFLSYTYAIPPLIPAAKFLPIWPSITTLPPVMYSHPWSPIPSTTAFASLLRTQNLSPAIPLMYASPPVAPYSATFPMMMFSSGMNDASSGGVITSLPPDSPLPK